jgi:hypothetical protein
MVYNANLVDLYEFLQLPIHFNISANVSITPDIGKQIFLPSDTPNPFKLFLVQTFTLALPWIYIPLQGMEGNGDKFFFKSCLGRAPTSACLAIAEAIQTTC